MKTPIRNRTGFLLGAGASYESGLPLVDELSVEFKKAHKRIFDMPYYSVPPEIRDVLFPLLHDFDLNYEEIVGRIEVEAWRCRGGSSLYQEWHGVLQRYLESIQVLLLERHLKNTYFIESRIQYFEPLKDYCQNGPVWVFSLNHDLILEILARALDIPLRHGFHETPMIAGHRFQVLTKDHMDRNQTSFSASENGINLVRIHGALDIYTHNDHDYLKLVGSGDAFSTGVEMQQLMKEDVSVAQGVKATNHICYFDDKGVLQFLGNTIISGKHKFSTQVSYKMDDWFFKSFKVNLNYVHHLICVGVSFLDSHVNDVLYDWLSFTAERRITIINPGMSQIPDKFRHLAPQIDLQQVGFLEYLNRDRPKMLPRIKRNLRLRNFGRRIFLSSAVDKPRNMRERVKKTIFFGMEAFRNGSIMKPMVVFQKKRETDDKSSSGPKQS